MKAQEKQVARDMFLHTGKSQKEIAEILGIDPKTVYLWIKNGCWEEMKAAARHAPGIITQQLYNHITAINDDISDREGHKPTFQEVEMLRKLVVTTKHMQQMNLGTYVQVFQELTSFAYQHTKDQALTVKITEIADKYISGMAYRKKLNMTEHNKAMEENFREIATQEKEGAELQPQGYSFAGTTHGNHSAGSAVIAIDSSNVSTGGNRAFSGHSGNVDNPANAAATAHSVQNLAAEIPDLKNSDYMEIFPASTCGDPKS